MAAIRHKSCAPRLSLVPFYCFIITILETSSLSSSDGIGYEVIKKSPDSIASPTTVDTTRAPFFQEFSPTKRTSRFFENKPMASHGIHATYNNTSKTNVTLLLRDLVAGPTTPIVSERVSGSWQESSLYSSPDWKPTVFDMPSSSLALPPEYSLPIDCQMCTSCLAGIKVLGTSHVILDGNDHEISPNEIAQYHTTTTVRCGAVDDPAFASVGLLPIVHTIDFGDGNFDQKVVIGGTAAGTSRTKAKFRHIFSTPGFHKVTAIASCSGCSVIPSLPRIDTAVEHTLAECATPDEFRHVRDADRPLGGFLGRYSLTSSSKSGRVSDFRNCRVRECVTHESQTLCSDPVTAYRRPSAPWEDGDWVYDTTIAPETKASQALNTRSGTLLNMHEDRLDRLVYQDEYEKASIVGSQFYQMYCPCQRTTTWNVIPSLDGTSSNALE